jgi:hypothetical protein
MQCDDDWDDQRYIKMKSEQEMKGLVHYLSKLGELSEGVVFLSGGEVIRDAW